jgi:exo-rhamnogalacturonan lyase-like protein
MMIRLFLLSALLCSPAFAAERVSAVEPGDDKPITTVTVDNLGKAARPAGPVTFGMVFAQGDVPRGKTIIVKGCAAQANIKRRWPDGSVKHAILTAQLPAMKAGASQPVELMRAVMPDVDMAPPKPVAEALAADLDCQVKFSIPDGPTETASLRSAIKQAKTTTRWLDGLWNGLAEEFILKTVPVDKDGVADPDIEVRFHVRYYPATKSARIVVVVENCRWKSPGNIPYDVTITLNGKQAYAKKEAGRWNGYNREKEYMGHSKWARWVKRFWVGRPLDDVHVRYDLKYLNTTGLLPRYDTTAPVAERSIARMVAAWKKSRIDILQNGFILPYFPTTGGRSDIGPLPGWTATYLMSQDPRAKQVVLGLGDLAGSCPVHFREAKTDLPPTLDDHPTYSLNTRGTRERIKPRDTADTPYVLPTHSYFRVDSAHQGSFAYVPYLITGDYYYLEEMQFWANYNMIKIHYHYRKQAAGMLTPNQVRGVAWALRNHLHAAALSPDRSKAKKYFEAKLANNLKYLNQFTKGPMATPIGSYTIGAGHAYTRGWAYPMRMKYYSVPGWQHNFLTWCLAHVCDHGYDAKAIRDYMMKWTIGSVTHPDEITPHAGSAYYVFVGERTGKKTAKWARTWKEVSHLTYTAPGEKVRKPPTKTGGNYAHIARGVLIQAIQTEQPGAWKAYEWLNTQLPNGGKLPGGHKWAFEIPEKEAE